MAAVNPVDWQNLQVEVVRLSTALAAAQQENQNPILAPGSMLMLRQGSGPSLFEHRRQTHAAADTCRGKASSYFY